MDSQKEIGKIVDILVISPEKIINNNIDSNLMDKLKNIDKVLIKYLRLEAIQDMINLSNHENNIKLQLLEIFKI